MKTHIFKKVYYNLIELQGSVVYEPKPMLYFPPPYSATWKVLPD